MLRALPRTVVIFGGVSLLNDAASEMITPLLPIFLTATLGAGPAVVGLIEGVAESASSLLKLLSGRWADRGVNAKGLVIAGYGLSNLLRPLTGFVPNWPIALALRFFDRVGKGIRTAPRDALIVGVAGPTRLGAAFGFHRSMDHAGAVIGPLLAYLLLSTQVSLREVFYWSAVPGGLVIVLLIVGVKSQAAPPVAPRPSLRWGSLDRSLKALIVATGGLALAAVPETFIVLWASQAGLKIAWVPLLWASASLIKMTIAFPAGTISDRVGRVPIWLCALGARAAILMMFATLDPRGVAVWVLFLAYAATLAIAEPAERSIVGDHARDDQRGTAFGLYHLINGAFVLPGAVLFGALWEKFSAASAFATAAALTLLSALPILMIHLKGR